MPTVPSSLLSIQLPLFPLKVKDQALHTTVRVPLQRTSLLHALCPPARPQPPLHAPHMCTHVHPHALPSELPPSTACASLRASRPCEQLRPAARHLQKKAKRQPLELFGVTNELCAPPGTSSGADTQQLTSDLELLEERRKLKARVSVHLIRVRVGI